MENQVGQFKEKKYTSRGKQTLFRVTYRTQINLIRIADNKANMILGINAMIITILMGIISTQIFFSPNSADGNLVIVIPVILIMITALITALFAIKSAKPRLIKPKITDSEQSQKSSYLFFENIWKMSTEEYLNKMDGLLDSSQDIYENMIIDIHNQAKVLHYKYSLLRKAYSIFTIGYVTSIISFLILWLLI